MPDRWKIFGFMKQHYQDHGRIPELNEIINVLGPVPIRELQEGINEFDIWHTSVTKPFIILNKNYDPKRLEDSVQRIATHG